MIAVLSLSLLLSGGFEAPAVCCSERLLDAPEVIDDKLSGEWTGDICLRLEKVGRKYNVFLPSGEVINGKFRQMIMTTSACHHLH